ncbi:MAG: hypothetical protein K2X80_14310, partial [Pseudomonadaceae bacterium]|nr:hypothetical protein [Pseudomonadaceae bacterium]
LGSEHLSAAMLDEFRAFWVTRATAERHAGWRHRLVKWAKLQATRAAANPSKPSAADVDFDELDWLGGQP